MNVGIIGLAQSGKTTLFQALLRGAPSGSLPGVPGAVQGAVVVPDPRFDFMVDVYHPKKITPATVQFVDGAARISSDSRGGSFGSDFFSGIRQTDALLHVVDAFSGTVDPVSAARKVDEELLLADLTLIETRLERLQKSLKIRKNNPADQAELEALTAFKEILDQEIPLRNAHIDPEHDKITKGFTFLTQKPLIVVANVDEDHVTQNSEQLDELREYCSERKQDMLCLCATLESDIAQVAPEEEQEYLSAMGLTEPARAVLIRAAYTALGYMTYFTCGESEVHAWTIRQHSTAVECAGGIHSDLARGFIRLEVVDFERLKELGSWEAAKSAGAIRLEMKDYVVKDGDVVYVRFKVSN